MADINTKTHQQILADQAQAAQASAGQPLNYQSGSIFLALANSFSSVGMWLQAQILKVLMATRLRTSKGADVDSFIADFSLDRVRALPSKGEVVLSRFTPGIQATIPVGTGLRTSDGQLSYVVTADPAYSGWNADANAYVLTASGTSITVPIAALTPGKRSNVDVGTITLLTSPIIGIDSVINVKAVTGGADAQTDDQVKDSFPGYISSLSQANKAAIDRAISSVQAGLKWRLFEGADAAPYGTGFVIVVNDGSSTAPSQELVNSVARAVEPVRAFGISFSVIGSEVVNSEISATIAVSSNRQTAVADVAKAVREYVNSLDLGETLLYSKLINVIYNSSTLVTDVPTLFINGVPSNLVVTPGQVIRTSTVAVA